MQTFDKCPTYEKELCSRLPSPLRELVQAVLCFRYAENGDQLLRDALQLLKTNDAPQGQLPDIEEVRFFLVEAVNSHTCESLDICNHWATRESELMVAFFLTSLKWYIAERKPEMWNAMKATVAAIIAFISS